MVTQHNSYQKDNSFMLMLMNMYSNSKHSNTNTSYYDSFMNTLSFLFQILIFNSIDKIDKILLTVWNYIVDFFSKKSENLINESLKLISEEDTNSLQTEKEVYKIILDYNNWKATDSTNNQLLKNSGENIIGLDEYLNTNYKYIRYLFDYMINLDTITVVELTSFEKLPLILNTSIELEDDLFCKIHSLVLDLKTKNIVSCKLELFSYKRYNKEILEFLNKLEELYCNKSSLENSGNIYYFEPFFDKSQQLTRRTGNLDHDKAYENERLMSLNDQITLVKKEFYTNRNFTNLIGENTLHIFNKVKFFTENKAWYDKRGIPYHLGILLAGVPGSGKTSCIKAIANYTKRHIINVNFKNIKTSIQFKNLFTNNKIELFDPILNKKELVELPIDRRLYVLEEIDLLGDIVLKRSKKLNVSSKDFDSPIKLKLDDILTTLDGTLEIPGRMVILTSNYPEKLDDALIRGGRIDLLINFGYCQFEEICEYFKFYYSLNELEFEKYKKMIIITEDTNISYANLSQLTYSNDIITAINKLNKYKNILQEDNLDSNESEEQENKLQDEEKTHGFNNSLFSSNNFQLNAL